MAGQLSLEGPLDQATRQLAQQPARAEDLRLTLAAREELVEHRVRQLVTDPAR
jgi:hypothetical protein